MNISEFINETNTNTVKSEPIHISIKSNDDLLELKNWAKSNRIKIMRPIVSQLEEFKEVYELSPTYKDSQMSFNQFIEKTIGKVEKIAGVFIYLGWGEKAVYQILPDFMHYELLTWRNKNKLLETEQVLLKAARVGIVGSSVGSFAAKTLCKLGVAHLNIAELKNIKPSNSPRIYVDSIRHYGEHKLSPLAQNIYEFNPFIELNTFNDGFSHNNCDQFFHIHGKKLGVVVDAADDAGTKILIREMCKKYKVALVTGFDEKGCLIIERYDRGDFKSLSPDFNLSELEVLKKSDLHAYTMKFLEFFPDGHKNLSMRQKSTIEGIFDKTHGGFSQLSWEAALFGGYISKAVSDIIIGSEISGQMMLDLDDEFSQKLTKVKKSA